MATVSFAGNIQPLFQQYQGRMSWRFDLTRYEDVRQNAELIYGYIVPGGGMPPAPYDPFSADQVAMFKSWMDEGCPP